MVRHIVVWNYREGFSKEQNIENAREIKNDLENLINVIDGIVSIKVEIEPLPSSSADIILNSLFESAQALSNYQIHSAHKLIAEFVKTVTQNRMCIDYEEGGICDDKGM